MQNEKRWLGITELVASGFCFGFLGFFGKRAIASGVEPGEFLALRYLLAAAMMSVLVTVRSRSLTVLALGLRQVVICLLLGGFGYALFSSFYFQALKTIPASLTVILLYLYPVFVAIGGVFFLGEKISRRRLPALPIALMGMVFLVGWDAIASFRSVDSSVGDGIAFGFLAALFYAIYILLSAKLLRGTDAWVSTFWIQLGAGVVLFTVNLRSFARATEIVMKVGWDLLGVALVCSVLAMSLFLSGLLRVRSWEASLLSLSEPIAGVAVGLIFLGEQLSLGQWFGAGLILIALIAVVGDNAGAENDSHAVGGKTKS